MLRIPSSRAAAHLLLIAVQLCFASLAVVGKQALLRIPPNVVLFCRVAGAALVFLTLARLRGPLRLPRALLPRLIACAILGVVLNQLLFLHGLSRSTATNASVLGTTIPLFTMALAMLIGSEPFRRARLVGLGLALCGALVLLRADRFSLADRHAVGNLMIVANSLSYATFLVLVRRLAAPPLTLVALLFAVATLLVLPLGLPALFGFLPRATPRDAVLILYLVAVPTVLAYLLNQMALARAEASLVAGYIYLQPLLAALGAAWLLHERPDLRTVGGAALILSGIAISSLSRGRNADVGH